MKIAVCVSHVPDTATKIEIADNKKEIDPSGVTYVLNPYDEFAVEEALKLKEDGKAEEVIAVSVGTDAHKETIRKALAMGADYGVLLKHDGYMDSKGLSKVLADEIKELGCDLVFMGKQSVDFDNSTVGILTAELINYSCIPVCVEFDLDGEKITAEREIEGGREVIETSLPAVITTQKGLNEPRYPALKGIMAAKKKKIEEKDVQMPAPVVEMTSMKKPPEKGGGKILGEDASAVSELVKLLKEEAKVI